MKPTASEFRTQTASDIIRDGLGVELLSPDGSVIAEVFRSDAENTVSVSLFADSIPLSAMELLLVRARKELGTYEDGTALPPPPGKD